MRDVAVAAAQMNCTWELPRNVDKAESLIRRAAEQGANIVLIQELFETPYFCIEKQDKHFSLATGLEENQTLKHFQWLAKELNVVLPFSWFEKADDAYFNSMAMVDADGSILGVYRKTHIPDGPGYEEKFYFEPGDTGFKVWNTKFARIGVGICWDQWFPESARSMALQGAEILMYPTAIGSEPPPAPPVDSCGHWQRVMQGHAAANIMPLVASNRIGTETATEEDCSVTFYGSSFICDHTGAMVAEANRSDEQVLLHRFDLDQMRDFRQNWGVFRDRRPQSYAALVAP